MDPEDLPRCGAGPGESYWPAPVPANVGTCAREAGHGGLCWFAVTGPPFDPVVRYTVEF